MTAALKVSFTLMVVSCVVLQRCHCSYDVVVTAKPHDKDSAPRDKDSAPNTPCSVNASDCRSVKNITMAASTTITSTSTSPSSTTTTTTTITTTITTTTTVDKVIQYRKADDPCFLHGHLKLNKNWFGYLAILNLQETGGKLFFRFVYPRTACCIKILLYLDEQMDKLRANMNCIQKESIIDPLSPQVIVLSPSIPSSGCKANISKSSHKGENQSMIECSSGRILKSQRKRKWYIAVVSCGSPSGLDVSYSLLVYGHVGNTCPGKNKYSSGGDTGCPVNYLIPVILFILSLSTK